MKKAFITIDIEDWIQSTWNRNLPITHRSEANTAKLLELLDELNIHTTMFVQAKFAQSFPSIVKQIDRRGHEVASHGYSHVEIFNQNKMQFQSDVEYSKKIIEDLIGKEVIGFRAPDFSIVKSTLWAIEVLASLGFKYDSSIYPIKHNRYGIENFPDHPIKIEFGNSLSLLEFPIATITFRNKKYPIGGGGYHRLLPSIIINKLAAKILRNNCFVYYCHPYEFNKHELNEIRPRIPLKTRLHQGLGRNFFKDRFVSFVKHFGSIMIKDAITSTSFPIYNISTGEVLTNDSK